MQTVSPEQVRQVTESVLSRPEFRERAADYWTQLLTEFLRWLSRLGAWSQQNPGLSKALIAVLIILLLGLLGHIAYTVINEFVSLHRRSTVRPKERPIQALEGVAESWSDALRLAKTALENGDVYKAIWITHRVLLSALDRADVLKFAHWKTNSDYLRECSASHPHSHTLAEVTSVYERVVYAHSEFDQAEAAKVLARVDSLTQQAVR